MNFIYKIPYIRRIYINRLKIWAENNRHAIELKKLYKGIKMNLVLQDWVQYQLFVYGIYEPAESSLWCKLAKDYSTIYDVGANVGYYSLLAAKINSKSDIYAFEPINQTYSKLKENIALNNFNNIHAVKKGVSNTDTSIEINTGNENNWGMSSIHPHSESSGEKELISCTTIDSFVKYQNHSKVDMIKIDIEGSEFNAIEGMIGTIKRDMPDLFVEILDEHLEALGKKCSDLYQLLWEKGYHSYEITKNGLIRIKEPKSKNGLIFFTNKNM